MTTKEFKKECPACGSKNIESTIPFATDSFPWKCNDCNHRWSIYINLNIFKNKEI